MWVQRFAESGAERMGMDFSHCEFLSGESLLSCARVMWYSCALCPCERWNLLPALDAVWQCMVCAAGTAAVWRSTAPCKSGELVCSGFSQAEMKRDQVTRGVISTSLAWSSLLMKPASVLCILVFLEYSKSRCFQGDHGQWSLLASAQTHYVPVHQEMCVSREEPRELHFVIPISLYTLKGKEIITTHLITCRAVC